MQTNAKLSSLPASNKLPPLPRTDRQSVADEANLYHILNPFRVLNRPARDRYALSRAPRGHGTAALPDPYQHTPHLSIYALHKFYWLRQVPAMIEIKLIVN